MARYKVLRPFTDAEGTHALGSFIERPYETGDEKYDLDAMVDYGMLERAEETVQEALSSAVRKSRAAGRSTKKTTK